MKIEDFIHPIRLPDGLSIEDFLKRVNYKSNSVDIKESGKKAWEELHSMKDPTIEKMNNWLKIVPSYGCGCQNFARKYINENPPPFDDYIEFFEWTWRFHDIVDQKTGDERLSLEEARERWNV